MAHSSRRALVVALLANLGIATAKAAAWLWTGSPSMLAETFHSIADTGNQVLLLVGARRAERPADERYPFGYGQEAYFWSFVVALSLFSVGGGAAIWEGIRGLRAAHGHAEHHAGVALAVLAVSIVFEGASWWTAWRTMRQATSPGHGILARVRRSRDMALVVVFFEDTAALVGLAVALAGVGLSHVTGFGAWDALGSLVIGVLLVGVAFAVGLRARYFLLGAAASPELVDAVERAARAHPIVGGVRRVATLQLGPHDVLVAIELEVETDARPADNLVEAIESIDEAVHAVSPDIRDVFVEIHRARDRAAA